MNAYTVSERKFLGKHPLERMRGRRKDTIRTDCTKTQRLRRFNATELDNSELFGVSGAEIRGSFVAFVTFDL